MNYTNTIIDSWTYKKDKYVAISTSLKDWWYKNGVEPKNNFKGCIYPIVWCNFKLYEVKFNRIDTVELIDIYTKKTYFTNPKNVFYICKT